ncbi:MAG: tRNA (5-methylaminomethyl-2-thiouridine)(34)-methyltransferase MnmD [Trueperaceae bacterium]
MTLNRADAWPERTEVVLTRDGSRTLRPVGGEGYKSLAGALTEARHVYLEGSGVGARLRAGAPTRVLEIGFGTGLLFLVTASLAAESGAELSYVGVELQPPPAPLLKALGYAELLAPSPLPEQLTSWRAALGAAPPFGEYTLQSGRTCLTLHVADALSAPLEPGVHAVYHDAFSPRTNPALWQAPFLTSLASLLEPQGSLVSFSVAGPVRRALGAAGLEVRKLPGPPGGKREVLVARRPA